MTTTFKKQLKEMHKLYGTETYEKSSIAKIEDVLNDKEIPNYLKLEGLQLILKEYNERRTHAIGLFLLG